MSYDIYLKYPACDACGSPGFDADYGYNWNYTTNCAPMWRLAGADLAGFDGKQAAECAAVLREAIASMRREPDRYKALDPPNGWGSFDELLPHLEELLKRLEKHPNAYVRVWR
jgi:hypothetical protein